MRRRATVEETPVDVDHEAQALADVVTLLKPLRELRKHAAQRHQRQAQQVAEAMQASLAQAQLACAEDLDLQKLQRRALAAQCEGQVMSLNGIQQWHQEEQRLMDRQAQLRSHVQRLQLDLEAQRQRVAQAQLQVRASQRALEKLACLSETLG